MFAFSNNRSDDLCVVHYSECNTIETLPIYHSKAYTYGVHIHHMFLSAFFWIPTFVDCEIEVSICVAGVKSPGYKMIRTQSKAPTMNVKSTQRYRRLMTLRYCTTNVTFMYTIHQIRAEVRTTQHRWRVQNGCTIRLCSQIHSLLRCVFFIVSLLVLWSSL